MLAVGIIGYGTIGRVVARALDDGINGMRFTAVVTGRRDKAAAAMTELSQPVEIMSIAAVAERCDIVVDCAKSGVPRHCRNHSWPWPDFGYGQRCRYFGQPRH